MPQNKARSWSELKQAANGCFKTGQYGEAVLLYSRAISQLEKSSQRGEEDLAILFTNRAAAHLKDGNCGECVADSTRSLELSPFNVKSLLRRAAAYEALERYRPAYIDYKTALQISCSITAAHDGANRMTKALAEADGPSWREKLPPIPTVPLAVRQKLAQQMAPGPAETSGGEKVRSAPGEADARKGQILKEEGNALVKKGEHRKAVEKYSQSLKHNPAEVTTYTNRALCYLTVKQYRDAVRDCDEALMIDSCNIKALYRRAQAHRELKEVKACVEDLNKLLRVEPKNTAALKLLEDVQKRK
ncbi:mitochondrial import receptor subunit TOM34 [Takifugu rubripes]|uniref:Translocase of outer mitochondrial membrane 34 n=1 Tax=Takifugu rubripes TaxID=31033 RepID=H2UPG5_TAKRU|nr:mitochondrial import receptor subunit TOM34 [Takifugu rubripes]